MSQALRPVLLPIWFAAFLTACGPVQTPPEERRPARDQFWSRAHALCGLIYRGRQSGDGVDASRVVMHVRHCTARRIQMMIHVDRTHSRLLTLRRSRRALTLTHTLLPGPENQQWPANSAPSVTGRTATAGDALYQRFDTPPGNAAAPGWELRFRPNDTLHLRAIDRRGSIETHMRFDLDNPLQPGLGPGWLEAPTVPGY